MSGDYAVLPHDAAAEAAVLSAILAEPNALDLVVTSLSTGDFYYDPNRLIYEAMLAMTAEARACALSTGYASSWTGRCISSRPAPARASRRSPSIRPRARWRRGGKAWRCSRSRCRRPS